MSGGSVLERRRFFRLKYSGEYKPAVRICDSWNQEFQVDEISEGSLVFLTDQPREFIPGQDISAFIAFRAGKPAPIEGKVLRAIGDRVIVLLSRGISLQKVYEEEAYIQ